MALNAPNFLTSLRDRYGPVVRVPLGGKTFFLVSEPSFVQDVLVSSPTAYDSDIIGGRKGKGGTPPLEGLIGRGLITSTGEHHAIQRRIIQPLFNHRVMSGYVDTFADVTERHVGRWSEGSIIDAHASMVELTLGLVTRSIFNVSIGTDVAEKVRTSLPPNDGPLRWALVPGGAVLSRLPLPSNRQFKRGRATLNRTVDQLIVEREREDDKNASDLLSLLMHALDPVTGRSMSTSQIKDEVLTLLMAGHETTANALSWCIYLLSKNENARKKVESEVDSVLGLRKPCIEDIAHLPYVRAVLNEAMRIYPPVWTIARRALTDQMIDGHVIQAGSTVMVSPWVVHRDSRWWPDPEVFDPDRWLETTAEEVSVNSGSLPARSSPSSRPRFSYFPFGGGPRQCIGNEFSMLEGVTVLATILGRWELSMLDDRHITPNAGIIVRPRGGLVMEVKVRS